MATGHGIKKGQSCQLKHLNVKDKITTFLYQKLYRECSWHAELPENSGSTIIFRCDIFHVGRGQESGRCWGDSLSIHSPNNDTLTLCGHRDGIHLTLEGYSEYIEIKYTSKDNSVSDGFSCLLYTEEKNDEEFGGDPDFDCEILLF